MKLLLKLAVTALARQRRVARRHRVPAITIAFRDAVREAALTSGARRRRSCRARIVELGDDRGLALEDDSVSITREERTTRGRGHLHAARSLLLSAATSIRGGSTGRSRGS